MECCGQPSVTPLDKLITPYRALRSQVDTIPTTSPWRRPLTTTAARARQARHHDNLERVNRLIDLDADLERLRRKYFPTTFDRLASDPTHDLPHHRPGATTPSAPGEVDAA